MTSKAMLLAAAALAIGGMLTGCSKEPDPNESGGVVKGLPPGGAPSNAAKPKGPFDDMPPELQRGPTAKTGGRMAPAPAGAPAPGAAAPAPGAAPAAGN